MKKADEVAREIGKNLVGSLRMTGEEAWEVIPMFVAALTADRRAVAEAVRDSVLGLESLNSGQRRAIRSLDLDAVLEDK